MKPIYTLLATVLFATVLLGGCVIQVNQPERKVTPVPLYQPLSEEEVKGKVPAKPLVLSKVGCKSPAEWRWEKGKMVCGTPDTPSYLWPNDRPYGYPCYGYPYCYGYPMYGYGAARYW